MSNATIGAVGVLRCRCRRELIPEITALSSSLEHASAETAATAASPQSAPGNQRRTTTPLVEELMAPNPATSRILALLRDAKTSAEEVGITDVEWEARRRRVGILEAELERMRTTA